MSFEGSTSCRLLTERVDSFEETYRAIFTWLKPGSYASYMFDFLAHGRSPFLNEQWTCFDWQ